SANRPALEQITTLPLERIGARRRDRVVDQSHRLAELRRIAGGHNLDLTNHDLRHRHLPQAGAIFLGVVAAVDLIVDPHQRTVRRDARHAELLILDDDPPGYD